jgi:hypothetical protein
MSGDNHSLRDFRDRYEGPVLRSACQRHARASANPVKAQELQYRLNANEGEGLSTMAFLAITGTGARPLLKLEVVWLPDFGSFGSSIRVGLHRVALKECD